MAWEGRGEGRGPCHEVALRGGRANLQMGFATRGREETQGRGGGIFSVSFSLGRGIPEEVDQSVDTKE